MGGPVCRHDEDVVVDEDSDDQDDKTNRLKVSEVYSLIFSYSSIHICICILKYVFLYVSNPPPQRQSGRALCRGRRRTGEEAGR